MAAHLSTLQKRPDAGNPREVLAWNVRKLRTERGWSQEQLAFETGLDRTYISGLERCVWNVALDNVHKVATALNVQPWQLLQIDT